ncbi:hypothetical protein A7985_24260 [Pseudoalteromonas luteoviolacea]|uniref:Fibronectin type-III domain-containing protein n=1 Tax=Pseudoalteromonas luteoviolacea TaxID=43657 RepID=A0A1C0TJI0_9GAMM|nr:tandem-95 repeat protein [Pseudoalteromonas luteoviolacea]OCQ18326.1 hypothetical protein A7985_24260 [Pseudoalteromonas luteoviolacea]
MTRIFLKYTLVLLCVLAKPALAAGFDFPTHLQFMLKNLRENAQANTAPIVTKDYITLSEDETSLLDLLANDIDADKDTLKIVSVSAQYGEVLIMPNGQVKYIPPINFSGQDQISYMLYDGRSNAVSGQAYITVNSINDAPVAKDDLATLIANTTKLINVLENDTDVDGDALKITLASAKHGQVLVINNAIEYTPNYDFDGTEVIDYVIQDTGGATSSAKVLITVLKENKTAPEITAQQQIVMDEDTSLTLSTEHITYIDADSLSKDITLEIAQGQNYQVNGLTITPTEHFNGELNVPVSLFDGKHHSNTMALKITVNPINDAPKVVSPLYWQSLKGARFTLDFYALIHDPDIKFWPMGRDDPRLDQFKFILSNNARIEDHGGWTSNGGRFVRVPGSRNFLYEYLPPSDLSIDEDYLHFFIVDELGATNFGRGDIKIYLKNDMNAPIIKHHAGMTPTNENSSFKLSIDDFYILYNGSHSKNNELSLIVKDSPGYYSFDEATGLISIDPMFEGDLLNIIVQATDGATTSNSFRVEVPLISVNEAPIAYNFEHTLSEPKEIELDFRNLLMADPEAKIAPYLLDQFSYQFMTQQGSADNTTPRGKLVRVPGKPHGVFKYIPNLPFDKDTIPFWVTDEQGLQSNMGTIVISPPIPSTPHKPNTIVNGTSVRVSWEQNNFATYYVVEQYKQSIDLSSTLREYRVTSNSIDLQELETEYSKYRVKACNEVGCSAFSEFSLPTKELNITPRANLVGTNGIQLVWGGEHSNYDIQIKYNDNDWTEPGRFVFDSKSVTWPNLPSGERTYRLRGCNDDLSRCTDWSAQSNTLLIEAWVHNVAVQGSSTTLSWGPLRGTDYYDIAVKLNNNDWTASNTFVAVNEGTSNVSSITLNNVGGGLYAYRIRACQGQVGSGTCSAWSISTAQYETPGLPIGTPPLALTLPTHTFLNKSEVVTWAFSSAPQINLTTSLYVQVPNQPNMIKLASSNNNQPGSYAYTFSQAGTYRFFAQACQEAEQSRLLCSNRMQSTRSIEVINQAFGPISTGSKLSWPNLPSGSTIEIERAYCADTKSCDRAELQWHTLATLTSGETSYALTSSSGYVYRIKVCFNQGGCTSWVDVYDRPKKQIVFIHTDLLGNPVVESQ